MSGHDGTRFEEMVAAHATAKSPYAEYFADPYRFFAWARAEAPVLYVHEVDWWMVARFDDIRSVFRDPETFSSANVREPVTPLCPKAREIHESADVRLEPTLADEEPESHRRNRRIFGQGFSARRIERLEPWIRMIVCREIDRFADDGQADLLDRLLLPVAARTTFHLLGGEDDDFDLADMYGGIPRVQVLGSYSEAAQVSLAKVVAHGWSFCGKLAKAAIENPGKNLLGDLVGARQEDPSLFSDSYLHNFAFLLKSAGADNQSHALARGIRVMLADRAPWERLCSDPSLIPNAVEEILRLFAPIIAFPRLVTRDAEVGGQGIPAGARLLLLLASGNRDETVFPQGDKLDIDRENARHHLALGHGAHFCLGAPLARLQMRIILEELTRRLPDLRLTDRDSPNIYRTFTFRGVTCLPVSWD